MQFNRNQLALENKRMKMKKVKKQWVVTSLASFALLFGAQATVSNALPNGQAKADTGTDSSTNSNDTAGNDTPDNLPAQGTSKTAIELPGGLADGTYTYRNPRGLDKSLFTLTMSQTVNINVDGQIYKQPLYTQATITRTLTVKDGQASWTFDQPDKSDGSGQVYGHHAGWVGSSNTAIQFFASSINYPSDDQAYPVVTRLSELKSDKLSFDSFTATEDGQEIPDGTYEAHKNDQLFGI
ncbi:hypothetical protein [Fructobacillus parabroussonetiae]|uniref:Uncharacterized protein n=1 Tax=Fructobacillus parabroussonetiae TaxID=2713174 RepID=A0ABS5QVF6_9LACO|nr:hypothetical protein [Fructobacillus parabroussonetiae]MBS9337188.1 hypothetical protein [Fructobacillus parabroussonetiae]